MDKLIIDDSIISDETFPKIFLKFIFLSQIFIEYKIGIITNDEIIKEFNSVNLLDNLIELNKKIEEYLNKNNINYNYFINCETLFKLLKNIDCIKEKDKLYKNISYLLKQLQEKN